MKKQRKDKRVAVLGGDTSGLPSRLMDGTRAPDAPVNQVTKVRYEDALKQREAGTLMRAVLTDEGWVMPSDRGPVRRQGGST